MVKTKKNNAHRPLVVTGYVLFFLLLVATLLSTTIPLGALLFDPRALHFNVAIEVVTLTIGGILPVVLGYAIGDRAVKSKSRLSHHFHGVLLSLLTYWLMTFIIMLTIPTQLFVENNTRLIFASLFPSIITVIITSILTIAHVRSRHANKDILEYKPFSVTLFASIIALFLWLVVGDVTARSVTVYSLLPLVVTIVFGLVSYISLRKTKLSTYSKVVWSVVSLSVLSIAVFVLVQLVYAVSNYLLVRPMMETHAIISAIGELLGVIAWLVYWIKQVRAL